MSSVAALSTPLPGPVQISGESIFVLVAAEKRMLPTLIQHLRYLLTDFHVSDAGAGEVYSGVIGLVTETEAQGGSHAGR